MKAAAEGALFCYHNCGSKIHDDFAAIFNDVWFSYAYHDNPNNNASFRDSAIDSSAKGRKNKSGCS